jgi:hypothetical protein
MSYESADARQLPQSALKSCTCCRAVPFVIQTIVLAVADDLSGEKWWSMYLLKDLNGHNKGRMLKR